MNNNNNNNCYYYYYYYFYNHYNYYYYYYYYYYYNNHYNYYYYYYYYYFFYNVCVLFIQPICVLTVQLPLNTRRTGTKSPGPRASTDDQRSWTLGRYTCLSDPMPVLFVDDMVSNNGNHVLFVDGRFFDTECSQRSKERMEMFLLGWTFRDFERGGPFTGLFLKCCRFGTGNSQTKIVTFWVSCIPKDFLAFLIINLTKHALVWSSQNDSLVNEGLLC